VRGEDRERWGETYDDEGEDIEHEEHQEVGESQLLPWIHHSHQNVASGGILDQNIEQ
jgi:hypothetical protein